MTLSDLRGAGAASSSSPPLLPPSSGEEELKGAVKCFDSQSVCSSIACCGPSERIFFPAKLHDIVSAPSTDDIIRWLPSGNAFIITDKKRFAQEILPRCFSQQNTQFTSFTRKLSRWCFNRVPRGPLIGAYFHDLFIKDRRDLCYQMDCKSENGGKKKKTAPRTPPVANRTKCTRAAVGSIQKKLGEYDAHFLSSLVEKEAMRRCNSDHQSRKALPAHSCHASRTYTAGGDISSLYPSTGGLQTPAASAVLPFSPPTSGRIPLVQSNLAQLVEVEDRIRKLQQAREVRSVQQRQELKRIILFKQEQLREQQRRQELLGILLRQSQSEMIQNSKRISSSTVTKFL